MTNLKEVNFGLNRFCGPAVLSALTGKSTDECAAVISAINGQTTITVVYMHDLMRAFNKLGFDFTKEEKLIGRTLYGTLFRLASEEGMYIVCVPHHVVAVEVKDKRAYIIDNHTKQPLVASSSSRLMQKVTEVYRVKERKRPVFVREELEYEVDINIVKFFKHKIYENPEHNVKLPYGNIIFASVKELGEIVDTLKGVFLLKNAGL